MLKNHHFLHLRLKNLDYMLTKDGIKPVQKEVQAVLDLVDDVDVVLPFLPVDENIFPVHLKEIQAKQAKDRDLRQKIKTNPGHFQKTVVEQVKVVTYKDRIYVQPAKDSRKRRRKKSMASYHPRM